MFVEIGNDHFIEGTDGEIYPIRLLSAGYLFEVKKLLKQIENILSKITDKSWNEVYLEDKRVKYLIDRCLFYVGLEPAYLTLKQIEELLFLTWDKDLDFPLPSLIDQMNSLKANPIGENTAVGETDPVNTDEIAKLIGSISQIDGIKAAFDLIYEVPISLLSEVLAERAKLDKKLHDKVKSGKPTSESSVDIPNPSSLNSSALLAQLQNHMIAKEIIDNEENTNVD